MVYKSPIPVVEELDYHNRVDGVAQRGRLHAFPQADGSTVNCNPRHCRECWREKNL